MLDKPISGCSLHPSQDVAIHFFLPVAFTRRYKIENNFVSQFFSPCGSDKETKNVLKNIFCSPCESDKVKKKFAKTFFLWQLSF